MAAAAAVAVAVAVRGDRVWRSSSSSRISSTSTESMTNGKNSNSNKANQTLLAQNVLSVCSCASQYLKLQTRTARIGECFRWPQKRIYFLLGIFAQALGICTK